MDEIITPSQVAKLLKIHVKTVYRLAREGAITGTRIGRSWRFSKGQVMALVLNQGNLQSVPDPAEVNRRRAL